MDFKRAFKLITLDNTSNNAFENSLIEVLCHYQLKVEIGYGKSWVAIFYIGNEDCDYTNQVFTIFHNNNDNNTVYFDDRIYSQLNDKFNIDRLVFHKYITNFLYNRFGINITYIY